ncbi:unnamed protein product [Polarella glacialis]|uniref:Uncharacterized protein n=1 Tax=Polarella glacialis TaxID=89957 RepID=A0A813H3W5_POLGL|nr:unnamed protein product [Polarella glacialis]
MMVSVLCNSFMHTGSMHQCWTAALLLLEAFQKKRVTFFCGHKALQQQTVRDPKYNNNQNNSNNNKNNCLYLAAKRFMTSLKWARSTTQGYLMDPCAERTSSHSSSNQTQASTSTLPQLHTPNNQQYKIIQVTICKHSQQQKSQQQQTQQ